MRVASSMFFVLSVASEKNLLQGAVELVLRRLPELMKEEIEARSECSLWESWFVLSLAVTENPAVNPCWLIRMMFGR